MTRSCRRCGATAEAAPDAVPEGWSLAVEGSGTESRLEHLCGTCTRDNIRAIEARLPEEWWE